MSVIYRKGAYYPGTTQNQTTTSTSAITAAFGTSTSIIRVAVQNDTYIKPTSSTSTTATTSHMIIPAGKVEFLAVDSSTYLAHKAVSTAGWISVTEWAESTAESQGS